MRLFDELAQRYQRYDMNSNKILTGADNMNNIKFLLIGIAVLIVAIFTVVVATSVILLYLAYTLLAIGIIICILGVRISD